MGGFGELWQMDTTMGAWLEGYKRVYVVAILDDFSRAIVAPRVFASDSTYHSLVSLRQAMERYGDEVVRELQDWGFLDAAEVVDPTWIDVAYTWSWPGSTWTRLAMRALEQHRVFPAGRYGRWTFQGIAESIREGLAAGAALRGA